MKPETVSPTVPISEEKSKLLHKSGCLINILLSINKYRARTTNNEKQ